MMGFKAASAALTTLGFSGVSKQWWDLKIVFDVILLRFSEVLVNNDGI